ncbi:MAG: glycoside hydrolase family 9 protein, partial [Bacteroidales bacterium]
MMKKKLAFIISSIIWWMGCYGQPYNYAEALQKSLYFYDAEKCGTGINGGRLSWRGDCHVSDQRLPLNTTMTNMSAAFINANRAVLDPDGDGTIDLSGGYHDAGDHVKFGLPQSYATSTLEWAFYEFKDAFVRIGEAAHMRELLRWGSDYYLKSTFLNASGQVVAFCYQVGEGNIDHNFWGPPELVDTKLYPRPAYFATAETPASDQCAGAAASLALSYLNNKIDDPTYAAKCLKYAEALYRFAVQYRGLGYSGGFYNSSYDEDELAWAAIWLYIATQNTNYLDDIIRKDNAGVYTGWLGKIIRSAQDQWQNIWVHSWDTKWGGVFAKLAPITNDAFHWYIFRWNLEYWSGFPHENPSDNTYLVKTPAGFSFLNSWGSARYNAAAQFQAMVYRKYADNRFDAWVQSQMQYILGNNPLNRSYVVGYSNNYAKHPHHRAAHGSPSNSMFDPPEHKHILWGALVGGPGSEDEHVDATNDFIYNEVAIDYNAGLVGALAGLCTYFGQDHQPVANFPPADPPLIEYRIQAKIEQENSERSQISIKVTNESAFPPRKEIPIVARYYFSIAEMLPYNQTISDVTFAVYYDENAVNGDPVQAIGPLPFDAQNGIYYMEFRWPTSGFYGSREFQFGLIAKQDANFVAHWDPTNDYSHLGLTNTYSDNSKVPMYANGRLVAGTEPGTSQTIPVTGVTVSPTTLSLTVGQTATLTATV